MLSGMSHLINDQFFAIAQGQSALQNVNPAKYRRQQIIEVVRNASRQLADGLHLSCLDELLLQALLRRDVQQGAGPTRTAIGIVIDADALLEEMPYLAIVIGPAVMKGDGLRTGIELRKIDR